MMTWFIRLLNPTIYAITTVIRAGSKTVSKKRMISGGPEFRALQLNRKLKAFFHVVYTSFCYQNVQKYMAKNIYEMQNKQITAGTCINLSLIHI